jgi:hypothetical protein
MAVKRRRRRKKEDGEADAKWEARREAGRQARECGLENGEKRKKVNVSWAGNFRPALGFWDYPEAFRISRADV